MKSVSFCFPREIQKTQIFPLEPFATWLSIPRKIGKPRLVPHNWRSLFFNASIKSVAVRLLDWNKFNFPTFFSILPETCHNQNSHFPSRNMPVPGQQGSHNPTPHRLPDGCQIHLTYGPLDGSSGNANGQSVFPKKIHRRKKTHFIQCHLLTEAWKRECIPFLVLFMLFLRGFPPIMVQCVLLSAKWSREIW